MTSQPSASMWNPSEACSVVALDASPFGNICIPSQCCINGFSEKKGAIGIWRIRRNNQKNPPGVPQEAPADTAREARSHFNDLEQCLHA
jgi:hypothetical protein